VTFEKKLTLLARLEPLLKINADIPVGSFCSQPTALITLDTGAALPAFRR
jgi:hypothetical protein